MNSLPADDPDAFFRRDRPSCRDRLSRAMTSIKSRGGNKK
jgi:hypothetical protein